MDSRSVVIVACAGLALFLLATILSFTSGGPSHILPLHRPHVHSPVAYVPRQDLSRLQRVVQSMQTGPFAQAPGSRYVVFLVDSIAHIRNIRLPAFLSIGRAAVRDATDQQIAAIPCGNIMAPPLCASRPSSRCGDHLVPATRLGGTPSFVLSSETTPDKSGAVKPEPQPAILH